MAGRVAGRHHGEELTAGFGRVVECSARQCGSHISCLRTGIGADTCRSLRVCALMVSCVLYFQPALPAMCECIFLWLQLARSADTVSGSSGRPTWAELALPKDIDDGVRAMDEVHSCAMAVQGLKYNLVEVPEERKALLPKLAWMRQVAAMGVTCGLLIVRPPPMWGSMASDANDGCCL